MTLSLSQLHGDMLDAGWKLAEPLLARDVAPGNSTAMFRDLAEKNRLMIWLLHDDRRVMAAAATGVKHEGDDVIVEIQALGGERLSTWIDDALTEFENLAFENGVDVVRIAGRKGWKRMLPDYTEVRVTNGHHILEKRIR